MFPFEEQARTAGGAYSDPGASIDPPFTPHARPTTRKLILRVWHVDSLSCPVCQGPMGVIAVIDGPRLAESRHRPPTTLRLANTARSSAKTAC
jgi:hypothetical protein